MPKAYSYLRFSTPEQAEGDSYRRQMAAALDWCKRKGVELDDKLRFHDLGKSGYTGANFTEGALGRFVDAVQAGEIERGSYLLIESWDRFSRQNAMTSTARLFDLATAGITVVTVDDGQEYSQERLTGPDVSPMLLLVVKLSQAHLESARKSNNVGKAWADKRERARAGEHKLTKRAPEWLSLEDGRFIERADRVEIVRRVFRETIDGYGRRTIVHRLNEEGIPNFRAGENRKRKPTGWHASSVAKILTNRAVIGDFFPGTGSTRFRTYQKEAEPIRGYYPAILDEDTYWRAQAVIASRRRVTDDDGRVVQRGAAGRRGSGVSHLLTGLGRCSICHGPMHIINKGPLPRGGLYFECDTARRRAGCDNMNRWRVDEIERRLLKHLTYIDADAILRGEASHGEFEKVESVKARLADAEKRRKNRAAMLEAVEDMDPDSLARYRELVADVTALKAELAGAEKALAQTAADPGLKARLAEAVDLNRAMGEAEGEERTAIRVRLAEQLRQLVEMVDFHPELSIIAHLKPRADVPADQVPFTYDSGNWRLELSSDSEPHGIDPDIFPEEDPDAVRAANAFFLKRRLAKAGGAS
ncbi:recombinase family protein [Mesorhizobium sp. 8]|uniref:recombinase family protein n=1 Tax=Mesorhizobium sp. 8 TaxID=2584466 RepID=UPI00111CCED3|nr:recombinase family protein [Mesorhizobium sp. 8]QDC01871.1 recombinase family protein [Mesorhizobium sp. 8]